MTDLIHNGITLEEWQRQFTVMWDYHLKQVNKAVRDSEFRLYQCSASLETYADYVLLTSYSTLVAIYHAPTATVLVRGRYSATTDSHVAKFLKWLRHYEYPLKNVVQDYAKSRNEVGYDLWQHGTYRYYKRGGINYVDRSGERFAQWRIPSYPANV